MGFIEVPILNIAVFEQLAFLHEKTTFSAALRVVAWATTPAQGWVLFIAVSCWLGAASLLGARPRQGQVCTFGSWRRRCATAKQTCVPFHTVILEMPNMNPEVLREATFSSRCGEHAALEEGVPSHVRAAFFTRLSPLSADACPQRRGVEMFAATCDVRVSGSFPRLLLPVTYLSRNHSDHRGKSFALCWMLWLVAGHSFEGPLEAPPQTRRERDLFATWSISFVMCLPLSGQAFELSASICRPCRLFPCVFPG